LGEVEEGADDVARGARGIADHRRHAPRPDLATALAQEALVDRARGIDAAADQAQLLLVTRDVVGMGEAPEGLALDLLARVAEHLAECAVRALDAAAGSDQ